MQMILWAVMPSDHVDRRGTAHFQRCLLCPPRTLHSVSRDRHQAHRPQSAQLRIPRNAFASPSLVRSLVDSHGTGDRGVRICRGRMPQHTLMRSFLCPFLDSSYP